MAALDPIRVQGLRKRYASVDALKGISFQIDRGEMFGLIGPDGAGKTTTIRLLCGLLHPDGGEVRILGALEQHFVVVDDRAVPIDLHPCLAVEFESRDAVPNTVNVTRISGL